MVELLLSREDIEVNPMGMDGDTPLNNAAYEGYHMVVEILLKRGEVLVNKADLDCQSPLYTAATEGHEKVVELLLRRGDIQVHQAGLDGDTPLNSAAHMGHHLSSLDTTKLWISFLKEEILMLIRQLLLMVQLLCIEPPNIEIVNLQSCF